MTSVQVCRSNSWANNSTAPATPHVGRVLSKTAQIVAKAELNEEDQTKDAALQELRDWVLRNTGLVNCRTDDSFLLRFLRVRKWSVAKAEHNLVKYLNFRQSIPHYAFNLDCEESKVAEMIHSGYLFPSPVRDSSGRKVIFGFANKLDVSRFTNVHLAKVHSITYETLLEDEENQVMGFQHFGDLQGAHVGFLGLFSPVEFATCVRIGEQAYPMRHKKIHFINMNPAFKYVFDFFSSRTSEKIQERLMVHNSLEDVYQHIDRKCFPKEYGGDIPMAEMIIAWQKQLSGYRQTILGLDKMRSNIPIRRRNQNQNVTIEEVRGSFKKLEVD